LNRLVLVRRGYRGSKRDTEVLLNRVELVLVDSGIRRVGLESQL